MCITYAVLSQAMRWFSINTKPIDKNKVFLFDEAVTLVTRLSRAHCDETIQVCFRLFVCFLLLI